MSSKKNLWRKRSVVNQNSIQFIPNYFLLNWTVLELDMKNVEQIKEKVRKLPGYGTHIRGFPPEVSKHIKRLLWKNLRSHFSLVECLEILIKIWLRSRKLVAEYPPAVKMLEGHTLSAF